MSVRSRFKSVGSGNNQNYWGLVVQKGPGDPSGNFRVTDQSHAGHKGWYTVDVPKREPNPQKLPSVVQKSIKYQSSNRFIPKTKAGKIQRSYARSNEIITGMATTHPSYGAVTTDGGNPFEQNFRRGGDTGVKEETLYPSEKNIKQENRFIKRNNNLVTEEISTKGDGDAVDDLEQNFVIVPKAKKPDEDVVVKNEESVVNDIDMNPAENITGVKTIVPFEYNVMDRVNVNVPLPIKPAMDVESEQPNFADINDAAGGIMELLRSLAAPPIDDEPMLPAPKDTIETIHDTVQDTVDTIPPGKPIGGIPTVNKTTVTTPPVITKNNPPGGPPPIPTVDDPMEPAVRIEHPAGGPTVSEPVESKTGQYPTGGPTVEDITGKEQLAEPVPPADRIPSGLNDQQVLQLYFLFQSRGFTDHVAKLFQLYPGLVNEFQRKPFGPTLPSPTENSRSVVTGRKGIRQIGESMVGKRRPYLIKPVSKIPLKALPPTIAKPSAIYPPPSNNVGVSSKSSMSTPAPIRVQPPRAAKKAVAARKAAVAAVEKKAPKKVPTRVQPARAVKKAVEKKVAAKKSVKAAVAKRVQPPRAAKSKSIKEKTKVGEASIMTPEGEAGITTPGVRRSARLAATKNKKGG